MKQNKLINFFLVPVIISIFASCSFDFFPKVEKNHVFSFNAVQYINIQKDLEWKLSYFDENAQLIEIPFDTKEKYEHVEIAFPPSFCTAVLLSCDLEKSENFEKAIAEQSWGLILPTKSMASPASSVSSKVFFKLIQGSENKKQALEYASFFNWAKLTESLEKQKDLFILDIDLMASDIADGKFTSKSIKKLLP